MLYFPGHFEPNYKRVHSKGEGSLETNDRILSLNFLFSQLFRTLAEAKFWVILVLLFPPLETYAQKQSPSIDAMASAIQVTDLEDYSVALQPWHGDYDGMVQRRMVRIAVPYSKTHYFLDGAVERGISAAMGRRLEQEINHREGLRTRLVHVVFIPTPRNRLIHYLTAGLADIAMGNITITESHSLKVDFSIPFIRNSRELVVTGPGAPMLSSINDLAGQEISIQTPGSYQNSVDQLSQSFTGKGLPPITIDEVDELLEPDEILELVQAGLLPVTVMDQHLAEFWSQILPDLTVHIELAVAAERDIAWALRKSSSKLKEVVDEFLKTYRPRTEFGNIILRRYLQNDNWVLQAASTRDRASFEETMPLFQKYGELYQIDPLLLAALAYQESRLDQNILSPAGAIGVMQLLPQTGVAMNVGDINLIEPNIHAGTRYLRSLIDRVKSPEVDRLNTLFFALASYNAGQTRIRRLRRETEQKGLDENVWLHNVELAAAKEIGRETVQYVRNIYLYYLSFRRVEAKRAQRARRAVN